jgi:hypothetical protein
MMMMGVSVVGDAPQGCVRRRGHRRLYPVTLTVSEAEWRLPAVRESVPHLAPPRLP